MGIMEGVGAEQTTCILINAFGYPNHPFSDFPQCVAPSVSVFFFSLLIFQILPLWLQPRYIFIENTRRVTPLLLKLEFGDF